MQKSDFFYDLPPELIANEPLAERAAARLLVIDGDKNHDRWVRDIPSLVTPRDLMVFNNTKVLNARLRGTKPTGGAVEILIERILDDGPAPRFLAQLKSSKKIRPMAQISLSNGDVLTVIDKFDDSFYELKASRSSNEILSDAGEIPLPPYIKRAANELDKSRYQTVYAQTPGSVAAPTAGLHFDQDLIAAIADCGVDIGYTTLHVGAGTFQPVRCDNVRSHKMHREFYSVDERLCAQISAVRARGGRVIAVGTTSARALESASQSGEARPTRGETDIFIYPGYQFQVVDALMTNFHLPESTLIMLVAAFIGRERVLNAYQHAIDHRYRFFSYGDAMWLPRAQYP